jgi:hypothetical protein
MKIAGAKVLVTGANRRHPPRPGVGPRPSRAARPSPVIAATLRAGRRAGGMGLTLDDVAVASPGSSSPSL